MERKIFQHLLELKSLQIRSSKINESVLVKRAVDDYHKSTLALGLETGGSLRRYPYKDYTFKNFEIFLYETLKSLQKTGTYNFQNISDVYKEVRALNMILMCALFCLSMCIFYWKRFLFVCKMKTGKKKEFLNLISSVFFFFIFPFFFFIVVLMWVRL